MPEPSNPAYDLPCVTHVIAAGSEGADLSAINDSLGDVIKALRDRHKEEGGTVKGALSIKIDLAYGKNGVDMAISHSVKVPLPTTGKTRLFINDARGVLTTKGTTPKLPFSDIDARFGA